MEVQPTISELRGSAMLEVLEREIAAHAKGIATTIANYEGTSASLAWMGTLRAVEELINLPVFGLNDTALAGAILELPVIGIAARPRQLRAVRHLLAYYYGEDFAGRFTTLLTQAAAAGVAFTIHGRHDLADGFETVAHLIGFLQSRRRHLVTILYTLAEAAKGPVTVHSLDTLNQFLRIAELGVSLTSLYQQRMLAEAFDDHFLMQVGDTWIGSREFPALDQTFSEPERASIVDMQQARKSPAIACQLEEVRSDRLFSAAELRNDIRLMEAAYAEFDLAGTAFGPAAELVRRLSALATDDYWITIDPVIFDRLAVEAGATSKVRSAFVHSGTDYVANTNVYAPIVHIGGFYRTTVTLLSRFLYWWKNACLDRVRRYQIRAGFIFEERVADFLNQHEFVLSGVKRINHKEFDVVAFRDGIIFNVQCKNNIVDLTRLEADLKKFARYNRALERAYERALRKEEGREALLTAEFGMSRVEHVVVSRFPLSSDNPRIIPFSRIQSLNELARRLVEKRSSLG